MGDRANVAVKQFKFSENGWVAADISIYLYTHWNGSKLPEIVQTALKKHARWDDTPYLTRIIFSEMIKNEISEETGYGIWTAPPDGADRIVVIDTEKQTVALKRHGKITKHWSFEEYCKLKEPSW